MNGFCSFGAEDRQRQTYKLWEPKAPGLEVALPHVPMTRGPVRGERRPGVRL